MQTSFTEVSFSYVKHYDFNKKKLMMKLMCHTVPVSRVFYDFYNDVFYYKWYWHNLKDFVYSSFALRTAALQLAWTTDLCKTWSCCPAWFENVLKRFTWSVSQTCLFYWWYRNRMAFNILIKIFFYIYIFLNPRAVFLKILKILLESS